MYTITEHKAISLAAKRCRSALDLVKLLNAIGRLNAANSESEYVELSLKQLVYCLHNADMEYRYFEIPKKSGSTRSIHAPKRGLKRIQHLISELLQALFEPDESVHGFVRERSIVSNAKEHVGAPYVLNVDLKDFFPTITQGRVKAVLQLAPFDFPEEGAKLIAGLCSFAGVLPQGSPASPVLTNIVCQRLDRRMNLFALARGCVYTRYADDMTLSSDERVFDGKFFLKLERIVSEEGFRFNIKKTRLLDKSTRQEVTGLVVNEKVNVPREFVNQIRAMLHNWETKGLDFCQDKLEVLKGHPAETADFARVLEGKLMFLRMVRGDEDPVFRKYFNKFRSLVHG